MDIFCGFSSIYFIKQSYFVPRLLLLRHVLRIVEIRVVWLRRICVRATQSKCKMVVFFLFIKNYKQLIFQHECIFSPVQYASGKALHWA